MDELGFFQSWFLWREPMLAAVVGGVLLGYLGFYVVLTRSAFVSAAVSQLAGLGVVIALIFGAVSEHAVHAVIETASPELFVAAADSAEPVPAVAADTDPFALTAAPTTTADPFAIPAPVGEGSLDPPTAATTLPAPTTGWEAAHVAHEVGAHTESEGPTDFFPLLLGVLLGVLGTGLFALPRRGVRTSNDAILAITVVGASAVTLVLAGFLTQDYRHVQATLFGDAVVASPAEVYLLCGVAVVVFVLHFLYRHRFLLIVFDPDAARAQGMATRRWGLLLGFTIGVSISVVTRGLGALPAFAFSVIPATAGLLLTDRLGRAFGLATVFALVAAALGYYLSFVAELPTGPTMVAVLVLSLVPGGIVSLRRRPSGAARRRDLGLQ